MSGSLQAKLDQQRETSSAKRPPEVNATLAHAVQSLLDSGAGGQAPAAGTPAPDFVLPNVRGEAVRLTDLLGRGPVVLAFYRGVW